MTKSLFRMGVKTVRDETPDIRSFVLEPTDGRSLALATPGSHIDVHIAPGIIRQYSLCNGPDQQDHYQIAVKREPTSRGGSRYLHERIRPGDMLTVGEPRNNFRLVTDAQSSLLVAGGVGITPLLSMARHLQATGGQFELLYFTRSIEHTAFHAELSSRNHAGRVTFHYALEPEAVRSYLRRRLWHHDKATHLFLCGPRAFMDLVEQTAANTWPPENVHLEYFNADPQASSGERSGFVVRLARSGIVCQVSGEESIVDALTARGVQIETSCEQGVCGTCLTGVLSGKPDHRDVFLTDSEKLANDKICVCVSRAHSDELVLDL